jgi:multiple sugar transport system permease protein
MIQSGSEPGRAPKAASNPSGRKSEKYFPYLLIAPTVILLGILIFYPVASVFQLSLQNFSYARLYEAGFAGLQNFKTIFGGDNLFYPALLLTAKWVFWEVFLQLVLGLAVALLLNQVFRGRGLARVLVFAPWAVSGVLTTMLWLLILNQHIGLFNYVLKDTGVLKDTVAWLGNPNTVFPAIVITELWRGLPFFAITLLAALQTIPREIYESCAVDGCSPLKKFFYITLPYLKGAIVFTTLMRSIWEFNSIDMIFTLTGGGPMRLTTTLPIYLMQTAVVEGNLGYGSALAVVIFGILLLFAALYLSLNKFGRGIDE